MSPTPCADTKNVAATELKSEFSHRDTGAVWADFKVGFAISRARKVWQRSFCGTTLDFEEIKTAG
jgi:hypothetical protein